MFPLVAADAEWVVENHLLQNLYPEFEKELAPNLKVGLSVCACPPSPNAVHWQPTRSRSTCVGAAGKAAHPRILAAGQGGCAHPGPRIRWVVHAWLVGAQQEICVDRFPVVGRICGAIKERQHQLACRWHA